MNKKEIQRVKKIQLRVTEIEKEKFSKKAEMAGLNLSEFMRELLENGQILIKQKSLSNEENIIHQDEKKILYGLANNFNQLIKLSHQENKIHPEIEIILGKIKDILVPQNS